MMELDHTFGDDGLFWISYNDFLKYYPEIDRIRLIGPEWTVTQQWAAVTVPWTADYLDTSFSISVTKAGPVVLVLSQPDGRYFRGFSGRYTYNLHFRLYKDGEETYLLRSMESSGSSRSCSAELDLEPGNYTILVKVLAQRSDDDKTPEEVIRLYRESRREKLLAMGKSFDLTHSKGRLREMEEEDSIGEKREERLAKKEQLHKERDQKRKERLREKLRKRRVRAAEKEKKEAKKKEAEERRELKKAQKLAKQTEEDEKKEAETKSEGKEAGANETSKETPGATAAATAEKEPVNLSDKQPAEKVTPASGTSIMVAQTFGWDL
jgi:hypothetical protein